LIPFDKDKSKQRTPGREYIMPKENDAEDKTSKKEDKQEEITPSTVKIGDKEYTPEQLEKAIETDAELQEWSKKHGDWQSLKSDYTNKSQKLADLEKARENVTETKQNVQDALDGSVSLKDLSDEESALYRDIKKGKGLTVDDIPKILEQAEERAEKKFSKNLKDIKVKETLERQISEIAIKNDFVDKDKLKQFMKERSDEGEILLPETAFKILYADNIVAIGKTPDNLPGVGKSKEEDLKAEKPTKSFESLNDPEFQKDATKAFEDIISS